MKHSPRSSVTSIAHSASSRHLPLPRVSASLAFVPHVQRYHIQAYTRKTQMSINDQGDRNGGKK